MKLNEATSLLGVSRERVRLAIEEGIESPRTHKRLQLPAVQVGDDYDIPQEALDDFIAELEREEPGRHPPIGVRRALLVESRYKCAVCLGSGPLEFHHILDWAKLKHHDPAHMLVVCPNCHAKITRNGEPDIVAQKQLKRELRDRRSVEFAPIFSADDGSSVNKDGTHPFFREAIKQLTTDEMRIMKLFANRSAFPMIHIKLRAIAGSETMIHLTRNITALPTLVQCSNPDAMPVYFDNLCRMQLLAMPPGRALEGIDDEYVALIQSPEVERIKEVARMVAKETAVNISPLEFEQMLHFERAVLHITALGKAFMDALMPLT